MIAILRDGRRVPVAGHHTRFSRTWQRDVTDFVTTGDGERVEGWEIVRFEHPENTEGALSILPPRAQAATSGRQRPKVDA